MEYIITKEMKALEKALNDVGLDSHFESYGACCTDHKTHYGSEIVVGWAYGEEATLIFTPSGKLVNDWLECPTDETDKKKIKNQKKKGTPHL